MSRNILRGESHPNSKLTSKEVLEIRKLYSQGFSVKVIAKNYKVSVWNIHQIIKNITWTHI